jgi:hypothetical protein
VRCEPVGKEDDLLEPGAMRYPSPKEFKCILLQEPAGVVVDRWFFGGIPYVFRETKSAYAELRALLGSKLRVSERNVVMVGSARLGFSPAPGKFGKKFRVGDDLDIIVVSSELFDAGWRDLLRWHHAKRWTLSAAEHNQLRLCKNTIFWGYVWPNLLTGASDIAVGWNDAFRGLSRIPEVAFWEPRGRLYRTWEHARLYHMWSLEKVKRELDRQGRGSSTGSTHNAMGTE